MPRVAEGAREPCRTRERRAVPTQSRTETAESPSVDAACSLELEIEKRRCELTETQDQCARHQARGHELLPERRRYLRLIGHARLRLDHKTIRDPRGAQSRRQRVVQNRTRA